MENISPPDNPQNTPSPKTETITLSKASKPRKRRNFVKIGLLCLFGLIVLLFLVLGGLLVWLKTESGLNFVRNRLITGLASQGITLTAENFSGPLPGELTLTGLTLADPKGVFLTAKKIHLKLDIFNLLKKRLSIPELLLSGLDLKRAPILPKSQDTPAQEKRSATLPVSVDISLRLRDSFLYSEKDPILALSPVNLDADIFISRDLEDLLWNIQGSYLSPAGLGLTFKTVLQNDPENPLSLDILAQGGENSPLHPFLGGLPWHNTPVLTLTGKGPISGFMGVLSLSADPSPTPSSSQTPAQSTSPNPNGNIDPRGIHGTLFFESAPGANLKTIFTERTLPLALKLSVTKSPDFPLPQNLEGFLGKNLTFSINLAKEGLTFVGDLVLDSEKLNFTLDHLEINLETENPHLNSRGTLNFCANYTLDNSANLCAPLTGSSPRLSPVTSPVTSPVLPNTQATNLPRTDLTDLINMVPAELALDLEWEKNALIINQFTLNGEGLALSLLGRYDPQKSQGDLNLTLEKNSRWTNFLTNFAPQISPNLDLNLAVNGVYLNEDRIFFANLLGGITDLTALNPLVGGATNFKIKLTGSYLNTLSAQINLTAEEITVKQTKEDTDPLSFKQADLNFTGEVQNLLNNPTYSGTINVQTIPPDLNTKVYPQKANLTGQFSISFQDKLMSIALQNLDLDALGNRLSAPHLTAILPTSFTENITPPRLQGELTAIFINWDFFSKLTGTEIVGSPLTLALNFDQQTGPQKLSGSLSNLGLNFGNIHLGNTLLEINFENPLTPEALYHLNLNSGPGRAGEMVWQKGNILIEKTASSKPLAVSINFQNPQGEELLSLKGAYELPGTLVHLEHLEARLPWLHNAIVLKQPVSITGDPENKLSLDLLEIDLGNARLTVSGDITPLNLSLHLKDLPFSTFKPWLSSIPEGSVSIQANYAQGGTGTYQISSTFATQINSPQKYNFSLNSKGNLENGKTLKGNLSLALLSRANLDPVVINFELPFSPNGTLVKPETTEPIHVDLNWSGNAQAIWNFLGFPDRQVTGNLEIEAKVQGTINKPIPEASLYIANGAYEDQLLGLSLNQLNLEAHGDENKVTVVALASDGNSGSIALEGTLTPLATPPHLSLRGQLRHLAPMHRDDLNLKVTGLASLEGELTSPKISARVIVEMLELNISKSIGGPSIQTLNIDTGLGDIAKGPELNIAIEIPREAYVRGRGLDSEWKGNLLISGTTGTPIMSGVLSPVRGYFTLLGKDFSFSSGEITFRENRKINPGLNITLTRNVPDMVTYLRIRGTLDNPRISFESTPPYPSDEVLSQVLFGKQSSQLSRFEALQLANSVRELTGMGGNLPNPLTTMRDALGLSVLKMGESSGTSDRHLADNNFRENLDLDGNADTSDEGGGSTIEAGKYLSDQIYVGVEQNLTDNTTGIKVEVELTPSLNLVSRSTTTSNRVALGWKHDY
jgi:hypothetical protein